MSLEIEQVAPEEVRGPVVSALWDLQWWPWETLEEYYSAWDWRYGSLSDGATRVWVARETDRVVGHIALHERKFRVGETEITAGIPGNYWVHWDYQGGLIGPRLAVAIRDCVRKGVVDMALAFANQSAHEMFNRLGFRDLGTMKTYVDYYRTGPALRRRLGPIAAVGGVLDAALFTRRRFRNYQVNRQAQQMNVVPFTAQDARTMDRDHWVRPPKRLVSADTPECVARRLLGCPYAPRRGFGLVDRRTDRLEGYVVVEGEERWKVWDCQVNYGRLTPIGALLKVADAATDDLEALQVPVVPESELARQLRAAGMRETPGDALVQRTRLSAYWRSDHPLAEFLEETALWHLWIGASHH